MANYQEFTVPYELLGRWDARIENGTLVPFLRGAHIQNKWVLMNTDTSEVIQQKELPPVAITRSDQAVDFPLDDLLNQLQIDALNAQAVASEQLRLAQEQIELLIEQIELMQQQLDEAQAHNNALQAEVDALTAAQAL